MTKTPEEYLQDQDFQAEPEAREEDFTEAEKAFLEKYLGLEEPGILEKLGIEAPVEARSVPVPAVEPAPEGEPVPEEALAEALEEVAREGLPPDTALEAESEPPSGEGTEQVLEGDAVAAEAIAEELEPPEEDSLQDETLAEEVEEETQDLARESEAAAGDMAAAEAAAEDEERPLEDILRQQQQLQLVSFYVGHQEFTLPIEALQEVVRAVTPSKVPEAPDYMAGLVNLRGRVTPVIRLDVLLGVQRPEAGADLEQELGTDAGDAGESSGQTRRSSFAEADATDDGQDRFIIVCRRQGLQVGLLVRDVATMYHVAQQDMEWNIESRLGGAVELVTALMRQQDDSLVSVLSIDRVVERILKR